jgi:hypothetical protein
MAHLPPAPDRADLLGLHMPRPISLTRASRPISNRDFAVKVHIVEAVVDHEDVLLIRDGDLEPARVGGLRDDTVKVKLAEWLVAQLMDGLIVLDW